MREEHRMSAAPRHAPPCEIAHHRIEHPCARSRKFFAGRSDVSSTVGAIAASP